MPVALAIERVDQWVAPLAGLSSRVLTITASTLSSVTVRFAPGRGSSNSPSRRRATKRARHFPTVTALTRSRAATALLVVPSSAQARMIRARSANAWAVFLRLVSRSRVCRSSWDSSRGGLGRPRSAMRTSMLARHEHTGPIGKFPNPRII
jgi:hypothetical protein